MINSQHMLELYRKEYGKEGHHNFMTPRILNVITLSNKVIELSTGEGFEHEPIFGVSVWEYDGKELKRSDKSKLCFSKKSANSYIRGL